MPTDPKHPFLEIQHELQWMDNSLDHWDRKWHRPKVEVEYRKRILAMRRLEKGLRQRIQKIRELLEILPATASQ
jgi:hypothetical protein